MDMLRDNPDKINWYLLSKNSAIFELDYQKMKSNKREMNQAIIAEAWHPKRVANWIEQGIELDDL
jgi:hypothetical protein